MSMTDLVPVVAASLAPDASWAVTVAKDGSVRTWVHGAAASVTRGVAGLAVGEPVAAAVLGKVVAQSGGAVRVLWVAEGTLWLYERFPGTWPRRDAFQAPASVRAVAVSPLGGAAVVSIHLLSGASSVSLAGLGRRCRYVCCDDGGEA
jgi:hypothetical protein